MWWVYQIFCSHTKLTVASGKGIQYWSFQEQSCWMDCCLQSAIHGGWKAQVLISSGVYAYGLQATCYSTLNFLEESHHENGQRHGWGHLKDDQGMTFLATCHCKYWTWLLGTWWKCEPISQCLDIKQWPHFFSHCHALDQWWMEARCVTICIMCDIYQLSGYLLLQRSYSLIFLSSLVHTQARI